MPNPETTRKLYDEMDFQRAVQTYLTSVCLWGYPAVSFESIRLTAKQRFHAAVPPRLHRIDSCEAAISSRLGEADAVQRLHTRHPGLRSVDRAPCRASRAATQQG